MSLSYYCPKCDALLNPNVRVILIAHYGEKRGLLLMNSQPGNYQVICDRGFCLKVAKGEAVDFYCPVCHASLASKSNPNFAELKVVNTEKDQHEPCLLLFSRISEEHATFLYDGKSVKKFGKEADLFSDKLAIEGDWGW